MPVLLLTIAAFCPLGVHSPASTGRLHIQPLSGHEVWRVPSSTEMRSCTTGPEGSGSPNISGAPCVQTFCLQCRLTKLACAMGGAPKRWASAEDTWEVVGQGYFFPFVVVMYRDGGGELYRFLTVLVVRCYQDEGFP